MSSQEEKSKLQPLDYAVYGAICAAKQETGKDGARRRSRIQERIDVWDDAAVENSLVRLMILGWVKQLDRDPLCGYVYYEMETGQ